MGVEGTYDATPIMLTVFEAISFVDEKLKVSGASDDYLENILSAFQATIPWQSVSLIATNPEQRHR